MTEESYIETSKATGATSFVGPDATQLFRVNMLRSSIKMHKSCGMIPTRGVTITRMFQMAGQYTGKTYKRGAHDAAIADLTVWIETMKSALPVKES